MKSQKSRARSIGSDSISRDRGCDWSIKEIKYCDRSIKEINYCDRSIVIDQVGILCDWVIRWQVLFSENPQNFYSECTCKYPTTQWFGFPTKGLESFENQCLCGWFTCVLQWDTQWPGPGAGSWRTAKPYGLLGFLPFCLEKIFPNPHFRVVVTFQRQNAKTYPALAEP